MLKTAARTGAKQYVILGAGLDTFAFRELEFAEKYPVFEVDHPLTQADKKSAHRAPDGKAPERFTLSPSILRPDRHLSKKIPASMSEAGILVSRDYSISSLRPVGSSFFCFGSVRVRTPSL